MMFCNLHDHMWRKAVKNAMTGHILPSLSNSFQTFSHADETKEKNGQKVDDNGNCKYDNDDVVLMTKVEI